MLFLLESGATLNIKGNAMGRPLQGIIFKAYWRPTTAAEAKTTGAGF
jgi:hypothetical protein